MKQFKLKAIVSAASTLMVALSAHAQGVVPDEKPEAEAAEVTEDTPAAEAAEGEAADSAEASKKSGSVEEIVITARRKALESATERKKNSDTMIDSVVADEAGNLPDASITEVLQRLPGITISRWTYDRFVVEGSGLQVRGLSGASSLLNGREIFGANGGSGLSWGEVTPELMAAVDVFKATRADMIEGGTGGAIDLRTKMPFDYKETAVNGALGFNYGDLVGEADPSGSVLGTTRFDTPIGEIGVLVDIAYSKLRSKNANLAVEPYFKKFYDADGDGQSAGESEQRYVPGGFGWGDSHFERERTGFYGAIQWQPTDDLTFFHTTFISNYKSDNNSTSVFIAGDRIMPEAGTGATFDENGVLVAADRMIYGSVGAGAGSTVGQDWIPADQQVDCNTPYGTQAQSLNWGASPPNCVPQYLTAGSSRGFSTTDNTTSDFSQGFTWHVNERTRLRGALQYVVSTAKSGGMSAGLRLPVTAFSMDITGDQPKFVIENAEALNERGSYQWDSMVWRPSDNKGTMLAPNIDLDFEVGDGFFRTVSAGTRFAFRDESDNYDGTYWAALGQDWNGSDPTYLDTHGQPEDSEFYGFDDFFHGNAPVPGNFWVPSEALLRSANYDYLMNTYGYSRNAVLPDGSNPSTPYEALHQDYGHSRTKVDTESFYLQTTFADDDGLFDVPYTGNVGVRYVRTMTEATGNFVFNATSFYMSQEDANADFQEDPTGESTPRAVNLAADILPRADDSTDTRWLPAFNINFKPTNEFFIRLAANQTVSRPYFNDITVAGNGSISAVDNDNNYTESTPEGQVDHRFLPIFTGVNATMGNTTLKPTVSTNFDLAFEWYPSQSTTTHLSLFHKRLEDLIIFGDTVVPFPYTFVKRNGEVISGVSTLTTSQATNADETATVQGFEFGGRKFFDQLPGLWSGIGVEANFTFIDSKNPAPRSYDIEGNRLGDLPVTGMSRYSYNLQLMYSKGPLYASLAWNWRSRSLIGTSVWGTGVSNSTYNHYYDSEGNSNTVHYELPQYAADYGQLDFGVNYTFNKHLKFSLQANNLTNYTAKSEMEILQGKYYPRNYFESDRRINAGLNFSF